MKQIVLNAKECSGRGVRLRLLPLEARLKVSEDAATYVGGEGTVMQLRAREAIEGVCAFVAEVTTKTGFKSMKDVIAAGDAAGWKKLSAVELNDGASKYFSAKDMSALNQVFRAMHDVTEKEVEDILGEALDVTEA